LAGSEFMVHGKTPAQILISSLIDLHDELIH